MRHWKHHHGTTHKDPDLKTIVDDTGAAKPVIAATGGAGD